MTPTMERRSVWAGRILTAMLCLLFLGSAAGKWFSDEQSVSQASGHLGLDPSLMATIAIIEVVCVVLFAMPWTTVVGAILLTGYMGGAILAHLRVGDPPLIQTVIPIMVWVAVSLREPGLRRLLWRRRIEPAMSR